jgi:hypothetical protein
VSMRSHFCNMKPAMIQLDSRVFISRARNGRKSTRPLRDDPRLTTLGKAEL